MLVSRIGVSLNECHPRVAKQDYQHLYYGALCSTMLAPPAGEEIVLEVRNCCVVFYFAPPRPPPVALSTLLAIDVARYQCLPHRRTN